MTPPIVSVVTPVYNGAAFVAETVRSVLSQTFQDWEFLIVDNASTDGTADIAEEAAAGDGRVRILRETEFLGIYGNHNRGLRAIHPESRFVKVIHADDWMYPECLERMADVAMRNPSVGLVGAYRLCDNRVDLDAVPWGREVTPGREILRQSLTGGPYVTGSPSSLLMRADLFTDAEPFYDETFWHADTEAAYRAMRVSDFGFVHQVLTYTRLHEDSNTPFCDRIKTYAPENLRMLLLHGRAVLPRDEYHHQVWKELREYRWFLMKQRVKPSRRHDHDFHRFHEGVLARILDETNEPGVRRTIKQCRRLLREPPQSTDEGWSPRKPWL